MKKQDVIRHFGGSIQRTADALGISYTAVWLWPELVPERSAWKLMFLTGGRLQVDVGAYERAKRKRDAARQRQREARQRAAA